VLRLGMTPCAATTTLHPQVPSSKVSYMNSYLLNPNFLQPVNTLLLPSLPSVRNRVLVARVPTWREAKHPPARRPWLVTPSIAGSIVMKFC
jgi:hypothetical protein